MVFKLENPQRAEKLFGGWQEGCIWSAMQGIMGDVYVDDEDSPASGAVVLGDFTFLAGEPNREVMLWKPMAGEKDFMILVPECDDWNGMIEDCYGRRARKVVRYAIKKERDIFDRERLETVVLSLPGEYRVSVIDEELFTGVCLRSGAGTEWQIIRIMTYFASTDWEWLFLRERRLWRAVPPIQGSVTELRLRWIPE